MKLSTLIAYSLSVALLVSACQPATEQPQITNSGNTSDSSSTTGQSQPEETKQLNLSISELNSTPPQDIFEEVAFYGGLGGGDESCSSDYTAPTFIQGVNDKRAELLDPIVIILCGLPASNENVRVNVELPDNSSRQYTSHIDSAAVYFEYPSKLNDPTGNYHFIFEGSNWSLDKYIAINDISSPSLFWDRDQLIFAKFRPNENVRLFVYSEEGSKGKLIGWKKFNVNSKGQLIIKINYPDGQFVAIGEASGEIPFKWAYSRGGWFGDPISKSNQGNVSSSQDAGNASCPGTLPTRLFIGAKAEVTTSGMAPQLSLRAEPSISADQIHVIAAGRDMVILDGPICADNSYWWYIRSEQGFEGWSREGDNEDYWIDPLP